MVRSAGFPSRPVVRPQSYLFFLQLPQHFCLVQPLYEGMPPLCIHESAVELVYRSITFGDTVKRLPTDAQSGTVIQSGGKVSLLHTIHGYQGEKMREHLVKDIEDDDLMFPREWEEGSYVMWKNCWL